MIEIDGVWEGCACDGGSKFDGGRDWLVGLKPAGIW